MPKLLGLSLPAAFREHQSLVALARVGTRAHAVVTGGHGHVWVQFMLPVHACACPPTAWAGWVALQAACWGPCAAGASPCVGWRWQAEGTHPGSSGSAGSTGLGCPCSLQQLSLCLGRCPACASPG